MSPLPYQQKQGDGLEDEVDNVTDAECNKEMFGGQRIAKVCEQIDRQYDKVQEERSHRQSQKDFDECACVFLGCLQRKVMLQTGNHGEIKHQQRHECMKHGRCDPHHYERRHRQHQRHDNQ